MVAGDLVNTASRIQSAADPGAVLVGERTPWPTPGNRKKELLLRVWAASRPLAGGVTGSYSPCKISVGRLLLTGSFWIAGTALILKD